MVVQFALKTMELNNLKQRAMGLLPNVPDYIDSYIPGYANKAKAFSGFVDNVVEGAIDNTKKQFGELRKAGAVLSGNPYSLVLNELIFPPAMADGTLTGAIKKHGYEAVPHTRNKTTTLLQIDPEVQRALDIQKSQMDAGISGTFLSLEY